MAVHCKPLGFRCRVPNVKNRNPKEFSWEPLGFRCNSDRRCVAPSALQLGLYQTNLILVVGTQVWYLSTMTITAQRRMCEMLTDMN